MNLFDKNEKKNQVSEKKSKSQDFKVVDKRTQVQKIQDQQIETEQKSQRQKVQGEGSDTKQQKIMQRFITGDQASFESCLYLKDGLTHKIVCKKGIIETDDAVLSDHLRTMYRNA